jgi:hypothetical protein
LRKYTLRLEKVNSNNENNLPIKRNLKLVYILSFIIASLMAVASIAGILFRSMIYPTDELLGTFISNDVVNLLIGLPITLGSIFLAMRGKLIGLLFWPGALFFVLYNYLIYVLAMPFNLAFLLHLTLVTLSVYTIIILVASIDGKKIQQRLAGVVHERIAGGDIGWDGFLVLATGCWGYGQFTCQSDADHRNGTCTPRFRFFDLSGFGHRWNATLAS